MNDEQFAQLAAAVDKLTRTQVHTMVMVAKLQAQALTLESLVAGVQMNAGVSRDTLGQQLRATYAQHEESLLDDLKAWLAARAVIDVPPNDPWWDKPGS